MKRNACLLLCVATLNFGCGKSSGWISSYGKGESVPMFPAAEPASGAYVIVPADETVYMVQVASKREGLPAQLAELIAARDALRKAIEHVGEMTGFEISDPASFTGHYPAREKESRSDRNGSMVRVTYKQAQDRLKQTLDFAKAVAAIKVPAGAQWSFELYSTGCSLADPEKHREQLVAKVMDGLRGFRAMDSNRFRISVTGLEKPILVKQCSTTEFMLSLPYSITLESVSESPAPKKEPGA